MIEAALAESQRPNLGADGGGSKTGLPSRTLDSKITRLKINKYRFKIPPEAYVLANPRHFPSPQQEFLNNQDPTAEPMSLSLQAIANGRTYCNLKSLSVRR